MAARTITLALFAATYGPYLLLLVLGHALLVLLALALRKKVRTWTDLARRPGARLGPSGPSSLAERFFFLLPRPPSASLDGLRVGIKGRPIVDQPDVLAPLVLSLGTS